MSTHRPRRRFSQNFLVDDAAIAAIVDAVRPMPGDRMVEIGPGLAALTEPLSRVVQPLHVVEIDRDIVARLRERYAPARVAVHEGDALEFDFTTLGPALRVVGNLPYHISTPILFHLAHSAHVIDDIHVMLQLEVVERMIAEPGASDYGRLSVMLQYRFEMEKVLDVSAASFDPPPRVESAVVRLIPHPSTALTAADPGRLERVVAQAFSQRRKTLKNTLGNVLGAADFATLGIDPGARAQTLAVADFVRIANHLTANPQPPREQGEPKERR